MSDISISNMTIASMAMDNQVSGAETMMSQETTSFSSANDGGLDSMEYAVAGAEVASRTNDFFGNSADLSSTGTDIDVAQAINTTIMDGNGTIADKVV